MSKPLDVNLRRINLFITPKEFKGLVKDGATLSARVRQAIDELLAREIPRAVTSASKRGGKNG